MDVSEPTILSLLMKLNIDGKRQTKMITSHLPEIGTNLDAFLEKKFPEELLESCFPDEL